MIVKSHTFCRSYFFVLFQSAMLGVHQKPNKLCHMLGSEKDLQMHVKNRRSPPLKVESRKLPITASLLTTL